MRHCAADPDGTNLVLRNRTRNLLLNPGPLPAELREGDVLVGRVDRRHRRRPLLVRSLRLRAVGIQVAEDEPLRSKAARRGPVLVLAILELQPEVCFGGLRSGVHL